MTEGENWGAQLSVPFGNGRSLLNIRAADLATLASEVVQLDDLGALFVNVAESIQAKATVAQQFPDTTQDGAQPRQAASPPDGGDGRMCAHKVRMKFQDGVSKKTGQPYKGYFCVVENDPRLKQCAPQFLN